MGMLKTFETQNPAYKIDEDQSLKIGKDESWAQIKKTDDYKTNKALQKELKGGMTDKIMNKDVKMEEQDFRMRLQNLAQAADTYCGTTAKCKYTQTCCNEHCCDKFRGYYCTHDKKGCLTKDNWKDNVKYWKDDQNSVDC